MNYYIESQLQKMSYKQINNFQLQLLEQKQSEINKLKAQVEKYQNYDQQLEELNQYIIQLNYQFQQQEQTHKDQVYFMQRELAFAQDEIKNLQRTRGQNEQQQIASLLKELSEFKQENNQLKVRSFLIIINLIKISHCRINQVIWQIKYVQSQQKLRTNSIQENNINEVKRLSPHMRVHNCSFTSPSQNLVKERRVPSLPDVNSNRLSINKTSFHNLTQNQTYSKKPPLQQIHNISPNKQLLIVRQ